MAAMTCLHCADAEDDEGVMDPQERAAVDAAVAAQAGTRERPPPWLDVTTALQFMTEDGHLVFHAVSLVPLRLRIEGLKEGGLSRQEGFIGLMRLASCRHSRST